MRRAHRESQCEDDRGIAAKPLAFQRNGKAGQSPLRCCCKRSLGRPRSDRTLLGFNNRIEK